MGRCRAAPGRSCRSVRSCARWSRAGCARPSPLYDIAGWASGAAVHELLGIPPALLNDDRLGRALETFAVYAEDLRSRVAAGAIERFGVSAGPAACRSHDGRGVSGAYEHSALVAKGWASDRRVARQVRTLQASTPDGTVLYSRPDPGNAAELTLVGASLERLLAISGPGLLIVCDSAMGQPKTMREIDQAGVRFVVPLRASAGFRERFLNDVGHAGAAPRFATCPSVKRSSRRSCGPGSRARCATGRSPAATSTRRCTAGRVHPLLRRGNPGR